MFPVPLNSSKITSIEPVSVNAVAISKDPPFSTLRAAQKTFGFAVASTHQKVLFLTLVGGRHKLNV
jgi:hypothetical protein